MTTKTHYTTTATWTPPAWVTKYRAVVAGGAGKLGDGTLGASSGAILSGLVAVSGAVPVGVGSIAGGAASSGTGGAGSTVGGMIAGGGGGAGGSRSGSTVSYYGNLSGSGGVPGADGGGGDSRPGPGGQGGQASGAGGAGGAGPSIQPGNAGVASSSGGAGGAGITYASTSSGGGGGGFGGGGSGGVQTVTGGYFGGGGGGGSSTFGSTATETAFVGYNDGAPYVDIYVAGAPKVATLLGPTGNAWADRTKPIVLSFQHNPDTAGDSLDVQTDAQVQYRMVQTPAAAWITVTALGTATATPIAANTLAVGQYEWQARTKADGTAGNDATGVWGPWSTSEYFQADTPPATPTVSSPASGATIAVATVSPVWSAPGQVEYQARLVGDNAGVADESMIYSDTGTKSGAATTDTLAAATNHVAAHVQVRIRTTVGGLWSDWADVPVSIEWAGPPKPRVTLATDIRSIYVTVTNPPPVGVEPVADRIEVYVIEGETRERRAILAPGAGWIYETPPSRMEVGIEAVAIYTPTNVQTSSGVIY